MHCSSDTPVACAPRKRAMREGRVWYSWEGQGWFWLWDGVPILVSHCVECGCPLPVMAKVVKRVIEGNTPWDGEDGG
jgi:hypothetical protein